MVDLPDPDGPTIATHSPARRSKERFWKIGTSGRVETDVSSDWVSELTSGFGGGMAKFIESVEIGCCDLGFG
jgi:hypothetical protein